MKIFVHLHDCLTAGVALQAVLVSYRVLALVEKMERQLQKIGEYAFS